MNTPRIGGASSTPPPLDPYPGLDRLDRDDLDDGGGAAPDTARTPHVAWDDQSEVKVRALAAKLA